MVSAILWALVGGTVLGLLGKSLARGERDHVPLWLAILGGIGGALLGYWLYALVYDGAAGAGVDWWRHAWQVAAAAVLVLVVVGVALLAGRHADRRP
jgi:hypothetical protein